MNRRQSLLQAIGTTALVLMSGSTLAQATAYPDKPIRFVVPYPPRGGTDVIARIVQDRLRAALGQSIIIEHRGGAGGSIGSEVVAGSAPDIIDETADLDTAAEMIVRSKTFDNATSCSSENSVVVIDAIYEPALDALKSHGAILLPADGKARLQQTMWRDGKLLARVIGQSAAVIAERAGLATVVAQKPTVLMVFSAIPPTTKPRQTTRPIEGIAPSFLTVSV